MGWYSLRHGMILECDHIKHPFAPPESSLTVANGMTFFNISRDDRKFANVLGLSCAGRAPWDGNTFLPYLQSLRNAAVEEAMKRAHAHDIDPLADGECEHVFKKARHELMDGVPEILDIIIPQLDGVAQHHMKVLSSPGRCNKVAFEFSVANLEYLAQAVHVAAPAVPQRQRQQPPQPFSERTQNVFMGKQYGRLMLVCRYTDEEGKKKQHSRMVPRLEDDQLLRQVTESIANQIQQFYEENHHPEQDEDGDEIVQANVEEVG